MLSAVCLDPVNAGGRPTPANLYSYGVRGVRSVFFDHPDWYSYHQAAKRVGLRSIATLARESFGGRSYAEVIGNLPTDTDYVVIGNEPDGKGSSSWTMTPSSFRTLINACAPLIEQRCPDAHLVAGGLVSGQPGWLEPILTDLRQAVTYLDIHPYSKSPEEASHLLDEYFELAGIPMVVFEWNRPTNEIVDFTHMLVSQVDAAAYFCWSDGMVPGFGLVDALGSPKPQLAAFINGLGSQPPPPPPPPPPVFSVGEGMRKLMAQRGDVPAADELYFKNPNGRDEWSECMAASGRLYRYVFSADKTYSFSPEPD